MKKVFTIEEVAAHVDFEPIDEGVRFYLYLDEDGDLTDAYTERCVTEDMELEKEYETPSEFADDFMTLDNDDFRRICEWLASKAEQEA